MRTQGKNVLLHLENIMLNGWNVPKWKTQLFYGVFDPHLVQYREDYPESYEPQNGDFRGNKTKPNSYFSLAFKLMLVF